MSHLVERISVELIVHRDEDPDFPYDDICGLKDLPQKGHVRVGPVTYIWKRHGLEEMHGAGDN